MREQLAQEVSQSARGHKRKRAKMQERAKDAQHIYQSQNRTETALKSPNEPNPSPSIPQSSKRSQIALKCVFFVKIRKNSKGSRKC